MNLGEDTLRPAARSCLAGPDARRTDETQRPSEPLLSLGLEQSGGGLRAQGLRMSLKTWTFRRISGGSETGLCGRPIHEPPGACLRADSIHSTGTRVTRASPVWPAEPIWLDPQAGSPLGRHPSGTNRSWEGTSQWEHEAEVPAETFKTQCPRADRCLPSAVQLPLSMQSSPKKGTNWKRCHFQKRNHSLQLTVIPLLLGAHTRRESRLPTRHALRSTVFVSLWKANSFPPRDRDEL